MKAQGHPSRTQKHSCMHIAIHTTEREPAFSAEVTQILMRHPFNAQCGLFFGLKSKEGVEGEESKHRLYTSFSSFITHSSTMLYVTPAPLVI